MGSEEIFKLNKSTDLFLDALSAKDLQFWLRLIDRRFCLGIFVSMNMLPKDEIEFFKILSTLNATDERNKFISVSK